MREHVFERNRTIIWRANEKQTFLSIIIIVGEEEKTTSDKICCDYFFLAIKLNIYFICFETIILKNKYLIFFFFLKKII